MTQRQVGAPAIGQSIAGRSIAVSQATIDEYGDLNGDNDIIHYDQAYAQERGFRDTIAHGLMSVSYLSEALREHWGVAWLTDGALELRWTAPVCPGDTVTSRGTVTDVVTEAGGVRVTAEVWVENQLGERILRGQATCLIR